MLLWALNDTCAAGISIGLNDIAVVRLLPPGVAISIYAADWTAKLGSAMCVVVPMFARNASRFISVVR